MAFEAVKQWWRDSVDGPLFGARWVTIGNGTHVRIDGDGRITQGGPAEWQGVHVRDVPHVARRLRELEAVDCDKACDHCPTTFPNKAAGVAALYHANARLHDFIQAEGNSTNERLYHEWVKGGRRGKKPELGQGDGRFDALNEAWELKGARRISTWVEAVDRAVPPSRKWADFPARLVPLEEAVGFKLNLPGPAEKARISSLTNEECHANRDQAIDALLSEAREGRVAPDAQPADVPF